jgi:hypothetical protein
VSEIECTLSVLDKNTDEYCSRICYMQDVPIAGYRTQQGREQIVFRYMQFMRQQEISDGYQIRFHGSSRKAQEDECLVAWNSFQASIFIRSVPREQRFFRLRLLGGYVGDLELRRDCLRMLWCGTSASSSELSQYRGVN